MEIDQPVNTSSKLVDKSSFLRKTQSDDELTRPNHHEHREVLYGPVVDTDHSDDDEEEDLQ